MNHAAYEREADELIDVAFEDYEEQLKKARATAVIKTKDPLERASVTIREFHIAWANRMITMANDSLVMRLGHADQVRAGL